MAAAFAAVSHAQIETFQAIQADADDCYLYPEFPDTAGHGVYLPRIDPAVPNIGGDGFVFKYKQPGTFTEDLGNGTARLQGTLESTKIPGYGFEVDVTFTGRTTAGSIIQELKPGCYVPPFGSGGPVNPATWHQYTAFTGTLTGLGNYAGAVVQVTNYGHDFQVGVGASGKNVYLGAAGWFTWTILNQPANPGFTLVPSSASDGMDGRPVWYGDFNINLTQLELVKSANKTVISPFEDVTYTYVVTNTGDVALSNVEVKDDNGTPDYAGDDFVLGTVTLAPGESKELQRTVKLPVALCSVSNGSGFKSGDLIAQVLPNGNIKATFIQSSDVNDNTYGVNTIGWGGPNKHTFSNLVGSDKAVFQFKNKDGQVVLAFDMDYISGGFPTAKYPSTYGTGGVTAGEGKMLIGSAASVVSTSTSLTENLNKQPFLGNLAQYIKDSPSLADPNSSAWEYRMVYTAEIAGTAFGVSGFGSFTITDQHNSPAKKAVVDPQFCDCCVTNTATAATTNGDPQLIRATAEVCVETGSASGSCADGKPAQLTMQYVGTNNTTNTQSGKVIVNGNPGNATPVYIVASTTDKKKTFFQGEVALNGEFVIDATMGGVTKLDTDTLVTIYTNATKTTMLSKVQFHTSCSKPLVVNDQFGSLKLVAFVPEGFTTVVLGDCGAPPPPGNDVCASGGKPQVLSMTYQGTNNTTNPQEGKVVVTGNPNNATPVYIVATNKKKNKTYFQGSVALNGEFAIDATMAGTTKLDTDTLVTIYADSTKKNVLSTVLFHTSCSKPLVVDDQFGSLKLKGFLLEP